MDEQAGTSGENVTTQDEVTNPSIWAPSDAMEHGRTMDLAFLLKEDGRTMDLAFLLKEAMSQEIIKKNQPIYDAAPQPTTLKLH